MIGFLSPAPHAAPRPPERVDAEYRRLRRQVFAGIAVDQRDVGEPADGQGGRGREDGGQGYEGAHGSLQQLHGGTYETTDRSGSGRVSLTNGWVKDPLLSCW